MDEIKIKFVSPSFKICNSLNENKILKHIEKCGRICYQSEHKITKDSCYQFVKNIISRGHESVLEHYSFSVIFTCSRSLSHQLVRHRIASFSEQSQRYCNFNGKVPLMFIIPHWMNPKDKEFLLKNIIVCKDYSDIYDNYQNLSSDTLMYIDSLWSTVDTYNGLIQAGFKPQEARSVLPNSTKTQIVVTANLREWRHILKLRTSAGADPEIRELMNPFLNELKEKLPIIFSDIEGVR